MTDWYASNHARKPSRSTTVRYVKNWTPAEDAHLVLQRSKRVPYKQIALGLHKTELACRLHYYQILSATRRGQQGSTSYGPVLETKAQRRLRHSLHASFEMESVGTTTSPRLNSTITHSALSLPPFREPLPKPVQHQHNPSSHELDVSRLRQIYAQQKDVFWRGIAASYSHGVSIPVKDMEAAIFMSFVPSPVLPSSTTSTSPSALSTDSTDQDPDLYCPRPNRCAVSALLNT